MLKIKSLISTVFATSLLVVQPVMADSASDYPNKKVRLVVPFPPGGGADLLGRLYAKALSEYFDETFWVENKPGAGSTLGTNTIVRSKPEGYDLVLGVTTGVSIAPLLYKDLPYQTEDLEAIAHVANSPLILAASKALKVNDLEEFIQYTKNHPNEVSFGTYGVGSSAHLFGEKLNLDQDLDMLHVAYRGAAPLMNDLLGKDLPATILDSASLYSHKDSEEVNFLALTGTERSKMLPDVKTFKELGHDGFEEVGWFGIFAAKDTPQPILDKLNKAFNEIQDKQEVKDQIENIGLIRVKASREDFVNTVEQSSKVYGDLFEKTGVSID